MRRRGRCSIFIADTPLRSRSVLEEGYRHTLPRLPDRRFRPAVCFGWWPGRLVSLRTPLRARSQSPSGRRRRPGLHPHVEIRIGSGREEAAVVIDGAPRSAASAPSADRGARRGRPARSGCAAAAGAPSLHPSRQARRPSRRERASLRRCIRRIRERLARGLRGATRGCQSPRLPLSRTAPGRVTGSTRRF